MKIGKQNKLDDNILTLSTTTATPEPGFDLENILNKNTLKIWKSSGTEGATIEIELTEPITATTICLINVNLTDVFEIRTYTAGNMVTNSIQVPFENANGLEYKNMLYQLTNTTDAFNRIQIILRGSTGGFNQGVGYFAHGYGSVGFGVTGFDMSESKQLSLGYIWCGDVIDFGCAESLQPFDNTNDDTNITRTNNPDTKEEYDYQAYNVTLKKENDFNTLRENIRILMKDGLTKGRPFIIDEPYFVIPEVLYGIFDATRIGYDPFLTNTNAEPNNFIAQATFGIREVF